MQFNYYYGAEADQFNFIKVPKAMMKDSAFASLSIASKLLYGLLLDRMNLSMKNRWFDEENRVYIIYQITEIMEDLGISKKKAIEYLQELEKFGLVEKKRRGLGLPSYLYVKSFIIERDYSVDGAEERKTNESVTDFENRNSGTLRGDNSDTSRGVEMGTSRGSNVDTSRSTNFVTSRSVEMERQKVSMATPQNKTNKSNIYNNNTNPIQSAKGDSIAGEMDELQAYEDYLSEKLELELLRERYPEDAELLDGIYNLILETLICKKETICVASNDFPVQIVKSRMMKLDSSHIEYVLSCMKSNTTKIRNIKKYLLAALFNAPATMKSYYQAEFNHDLPQYTVDLRT